MAAAAFTRDSSGTSASGSFLPVEVSLNFRTVAQRRVPNSSSSLPAELRGGTVGGGVSTATSRFYVKPKKNWPVNHTGAVNHALVLLLT